MTRIIATLSFFLLIPAIYWDISQHINDTAKTYFDFVLQSPGYVLSTVAFLWVCMFFAGHVVWLACRAFNKVMAVLAH